MRTTVNIDEHVLVLAKHKSRVMRVTLGELVEQALRRELSRKEPTKTLPVPTFSGGTGVRPGVDLSSTRALLETLDEDQPLEKLR
jgi:hypothetical protein